MPLSIEELKRYSRHLNLPNFSQQGQEALKKSSVLIVGAGGLGSPVSLYLAAAGVGRITIVDMDTVDLSNLQRQVLFSELQLGLNKASCARDRLLALNPTIDVQCLEKALDSSNALELVSTHDLVVDGTDNFPTRYLVNDACVLTNTPNCYGSIYRFDGQASVFHYKGGPCYRCVFPAPPPPDQAPSCAEGGVLGVLPALIGSIQATEALKILAGIGTTLSGRLLLLDALRMDFQELKLRRNPECPVCGEQPTISRLIDYQQFCSPIQEPQILHEMSVEEYHRRVSQGLECMLIDIRKDWEREICTMQESIWIPMDQLMKRLAELPKDSDLVIQCRSGVRSARICRELVDAGYTRVWNLTGGILAWRERFAPQMIAY